MKKLLHQIFSADGLLSKSLEDYELRHEQQAMAEEIADAYEHDRVALIEAGTGIGKSMAYLIPAILWAVKHKEKTVISTHTISLQEQLIQKDIPFLLKALGVDMKAVLVKGMGNYLCLRRYEESEEKAIDEWVETTKEGSRSDISFPLSNGVWDKVSAQSDRCNGSKCRFFRDCFFFKARRKLEEAQILVTNHHLLFADLLSDKEKTILPQVDRLILDEAHHLEEIALDMFSKRVEKSGLMHLVNHKIEIPFECPNEIQVALGIDLPAEKKTLSTEIEQAFVLLNLRDGNHRVREKFPEAVQKAFSEVRHGVMRMSQSLETISKSLEKFEALAMELGRFSVRLREQGEILEEFFRDEQTDSTVRWIEKSFSDVALVEAELDVSERLKELIFDRFLTTTLCSATLASSRGFSFIRSRLGIDAAEKLVVEKIFDSPFDYQNRVLLGVPTDIPDPIHPDFIDVASQHILRAIQISGGGVFVLFTSYEMLEECYDRLEPKLDNLLLLRQGDASRSVLIEKFKATDSGVLFGTDSFWEGVDVAGDALRCVILAKLPFKVPDDPFVAARSELMKKEGKAPFMDFLLPHAALKFKQGFGRLMRKKTDRGVILCLDKRLVTKSYGKLILKTLPVCKTVFGQCDRIFEEMEQFYRLSFDLK